MKSAIISGANGFLGRKLTQLLLDQDVKVLTVGRSAGPWVDMAFGQAPWNAGQWDEALLAAKPDVVFHLAGTNQGSQEELKLVNTDCASELFKSLQRLGLSPVVMLAGSAAECGASIVDGEPVCEDIVCQPMAPYGQTKLLQTQAALAYAALSNSRVVIGRIFNMIGAGMPTNLALGSFAEQIAGITGKHGTLTTGNLNVMRDFIDVEHVAQIMFALASNSNASGIVNICNGEKKLLSELVESMVRQSGKIIDLKTDPARVRSGELRAIIGSTALLKHLNIEPKATDYEAVVGEILAFEKQRNLNRACTSIEQLAAKAS